MVGRCWTEPDFNPRFFNSLSTAALTLHARSVLSNSLSYIRQMVQVSPLLTVLPLPFAQDEVNAGLLKKLDVETPAGFVDAGVYP